MLDRFACAFAAVASTAGLLACVPVAGNLAAGSPAPASAAPAAAAAAATPVAATREIVGQWDIVSFRGYRPPRLQGTTRAAVADFDAEGFISLRIGCNGSGATGEVRNGRFYPRPGDRITTLMGCGPEREARDAALFGFFDRSPTVERLSDGRVRLTAGRDELLLERPAVRRLAFLPSPQQLLGEWRPVEIVRYDRYGGITGIGLSEVAARIVFDGITAAVTSCPGWAVPYRYTTDGRIDRLDPAPGVSECPALSDQAMGLGAPVPRDVLAVLHGNPMAELVDEETILLSTKHFGLLLTKRTEPES